MKFFIIYFLRQEKYNKKYSKHLLIQESQLYVTLSLTKSELILILLD